MVFKTPSVLLRALMDFGNCGLETEEGEVKKSLKKKKKTSSGMVIKVSLEVAILRCDVA